MRIHKNQFGLAGQSDMDYDFFIGRGKRKKKKARKAMRGLQSSAPVAMARKIVQPAAPIVQAIPYPTNQSPTQTEIPGSAEESAAVTPVVPQTSEGEILGNEVSNEGVAEDNFLGFGKKAKERRRLKQAEKAAGVERMKAETATIQSIAAPPAQGGSPTAAGANATVEQPPAGENKPEKSKSNTTMIIAIVGGVLVVGIGLLIILKKPAPVSLPAS